MPKFVCVKLIDIDDRRIDYNLANLQPNFDIMYTLLLGTIIDLEQFNENH